VSTRGDYASRALLSLALHEEEAGLTSVKDIAERTGLPQPYLEQILLALKGAGLVRSKRGVGGGYVLARPPEQITLGQIVAAVDGPIVVGDFGMPHENGACDHEGQCVLLAIWADVGEHMRFHLDSYTLADIVSRVRSSGTASTSTTSTGDDSLTSEESDSEEDHLIQRIQPQLQP
jgi:Rrf2 family iron-sulfur cluster assembly transcriptional regulator